MHHSEPQQQSLQLLSYLLQSQAAVPWRHLLNLLLLLLLTHHNCT